MLGVIQTDSGTRTYEVSKVDGNTTIRVDSSNTSINPPVLEISRTVKKGTSRSLVKVTDVVIGETGSSQSYTSHIVITHGNLPSKAEIQAQVNRLIAVLETADLVDDLLSGILI